MAWFRRKGKYWYFVERVNDKEIQHYVGDADAVKKKLTTPDMMKEQDEHIFKVGSLSKIPQYKRSCGGAARLKFLQKSTKDKICQAIADEKQVKDGIIKLDGVSYMFDISLDLLPNKEFKALKKNKTKKKKSRPERVLA
ncbi:MAG TPA: hypothetical protein ENH99_01645 [Candidatus Pacearchaeota archaeon]|uniref:Uncharacterized protein n=1 Tax=marine sediment metagenome TaxID=412755 RepID=A0A0F9I3H4_9ZZZZ|nr:hypothetical protein [Candidatus Pacearchaeota archaeon]